MDILKECNKYSLMKYDKYRESNNHLRKNQQYRLMRRLNTAEQISHYGYSTLWTRPVVTCLQTHLYSLSYGTPVEEHQTSCFVMLLISNIKHLSHRRSDVSHGCRVAFSFLYTNITFRRCKICVCYDDAEWGCVPGCVLQPLVPAVGYRPAVRRYLHDAGTASRQTQSGALCHPFTGTFRRGKITVWVRDQSDLVGIFPSSQTLTDWMF
jgi:hypothetical protein